MTHNGLLINCCFNSPLRGGLKLFLIHYSVFTACHLPLPRNGLVILYILNVSFPQGQLFPRISSISGEAFNAHLKFVFHFRGSPGSIPSFLVFAGVQSPCLKQSSIVHAPAVPTAMFPQYPKGSLFWVSHPFQTILSFFDLLYKPVS